jgi:hypothetical protein
MDRSLGIEIIEGGHEIVLINKRGRDLSVDDLLKNGFFRHGA